MCQATATSTPTITKVVGEQPLAIADLEVINVNKLAARDPPAIAALLKAAQSPGFFYLSFNDSTSKTVSDNLDTLYKACHDYFTLPPDEKMRAFRDGIDRGYKRGPGHESFEIAKEEEGSIALPSTLAEQATTMLEFSGTCDGIARICLRALSVGLGLDESSSLENTHRPDEPSDTGLKLLSGPTVANLADVANSTHTDGGSLTLLWCDKWATQVQIPETKEWLWIEPNNQYVLVNVANSLQQQTASRLHSPVHRVAQPIGGVEDRYFISYFLRPSKST